MTIDFNKIYVIQSLDKALGDELTGNQLYDEVLQYFKLKHSGKDAELIDVNTPDELFQALEKIKNDCETEGVKPIIHFEIHGLENKTGLSLNNGDMNWGDLYTKLIEINIASKWNLFITMGVCFGNYAMLLIKPRNSAPFTGILGSFESLYEWDLYIRYNAFYRELLNSLDFEKALEALHNSNPALPDDYRFINSEQTFKNVYQKYFNSQFTPEIISKRFKDVLKAEGVKFTDWNTKHQFYVKFRVTLQRSKKELFEKDKETFFMFDRFPGHKYIYCVDWEPNYR
jgi:hypothetical protein